MKEHNKAIRAFEDYWALGEGRSLAKLQETYLKRAREGQSFATRQLSTLKRWSRAFNWQERIEARAREELEERRRRMSTRIEKMRDAAMTGLEADLKRYIDELRANPGKPILIRGLSGLQEALTLYFQLAGEPLETAQQIRADVNVKNEGSGIGAVLADDGLRSLACALVARASGGQAEPRESGDQAIEG